jgi:three-Cys-motif partner protein
MANETLNLFDNETNDGLETTHKFGGIWTHQKLEVLSQYLSRFTTAFKNQSWAKTVYIDAYAGTGTCDIKVNQRIFSIAGFAKLALDTEPVFDELVLIEQDKTRFGHLERLREAFPKHKIHIYKGDCNQLLTEILSKHLSTKHRGVIFVDPYGMNISWSVLETIASSKKLDVWYLFPLSGLYRQAARNIEDVDDGKAAAIFRLLGDSDWRTQLYRKEPIKDLFGGCK